MAHGGLAQLAAVLGAAGAALVVLPWTRREPLLGGLGLLAAAEVALGIVLVPAHDLHRLGSAAVLAALVVALAALAGLAVLFVRRPALVPLALLAAAPFRVPVDLGQDRAFLLLPLYAVLGAAALALAYAAVTRPARAGLPQRLAQATAALLAFDALSLLWAEDRRQGSIELGFFVFPFAVLVAVVARSPFPAWLTRRLALLLVALSSLFALVGLWQARTHRLFFAHDLDVANAYTSFFRVTSVFKDPSLYGRYLVFALLLIVVAVFLKRIDVRVAAGLCALLSAGLYFSYSQSSMFTLFVVTVAVALVAGERRDRRAVLAACGILVLAAGTAFAVSARHQSSRKASSGRTRLVAVTLPVIEHRPLWGVGVGSQPLASHRLAAKRSLISKNASHTTPLTVAAELGLLGFAAYLAFLLLAARLLREVMRRDRALGLGLGAIFTSLVVHSLFYAGFFEDPLTWGSVALGAAFLGGPGPPRAARSSAAGPSLRRFLTRRNIVLAAVGLALVAGGIAVAAVLALRSRPTDRLETTVTGVSLVVPTTTAKVHAHPPHPRTSPPKQVRHYRFLPSDEPCWLNFGGNPQRSLARPSIHLGKPTKPIWARRMGSYMEYPPSYCDGVLYVNTYKGYTFAIDSHNGHTLWRRYIGGYLPSTPAIAGTRLLVSSIAGMETALDRKTGRTLWQLRVGGKVESSPVAIGNTAYFGVTDGHLYAVDVRSGQVRWAYETGGRINASPSIWGARICVATYAGSILCLNRITGRKLWITYVSRNPLQYESFYATASTDGKRLYTISRGGRVVVVSATSGRLLWTHQLGGYGYSTPAIAYGKVFVGGFDGALHAFDARTGRELWRATVGGRILGGPVVVGKLVFFATLETRTYAASVANGRIVWRVGMGKYSPVIATQRHYFMALNGMLVGWNAQGTKAGTRALAHALRRRAARARASAKHRVPAAPKR